MTTLVFVHGVNTRSTPEYLKEVAVRDQLFANVALGGTGTVLNSSWGDLFNTWAWNETSLPTDADIKKDAPFALVTGPVAKSGAPSEVVSDFAKKSPQEAIDELFVQMVDQAIKENRTLTDEELKDFKAAADYLRQTGAAGPSPFKALTDDLLARELRDRLSAGTPAASYGILDPLKNLITGLADRAANSASGLALGMTRGGLNDRIGRFLGDVFTYLQDGGATRAAIRQEVIGKLQAGAAQAAAVQGGKLVAVGHSMGGIILYDLLTDPANPLGGLKVDLLVTVGSQVGVFEEMKLFKSSAPAYGAAHGNKAPGLPQGARWLNVYDPVDVLSFRCSDIFQGVEDFVFSSTTSLIDAHTAYFKRPRFFARFAQRL